MKQRIKIKQNKIVRYTVYVCTGRFVLYSEQALESSKSTVKSVDIQVKGRGSFDRPRSQNFNTVIEYGNIFSLKTIVLFIVRKHLSKLEYIKN